MKEVAKQNLLKRKSIKLTLNYFGEINNQFGVKKSRATSNNDNYIPLKESNGSIFHNKTLLLADQFYKTSSNKKIRQNSKKLNKGDFLKITISDFQQARNLNLLKYLSFFNSLSNINNVRSIKNFSDTKSKKHVSRSYKTLYNKNSEINSFSMFKTQTKSPNKIGNIFECSTPPIKKNEKINFKKFSQKACGDDIKINVDNFFERKYYNINTNNTNNFLEKTHRPLCSKDLLNLYRNINSNKDKNQVVYRGLDYKSLKFKLLNLEKLKNSRIHQIFENNRVIYNLNKEKNKNLKQIKNKYYCDSSSNTIKTYGSYNKEIHIKNS